MNPSELKAHLRYTLIVFLRRLAPARSASVYPDDMFLVSYPKSGNTWMRFLVGNLVFPNDPIRFSNVERRIPSIYGMADQRLRIVPRPRYLKSHEPFHPEYQNVIYIVRDPRDVAVSYFHFAQKVKAIPPNTGIEDFVSSFISDDLWLRYGTWADHATSWLAMAPSRRKFLVLRYEDLLADTSQELAKIASFLGIQATSEHLNHAIQMSSADRMRDLEKSEWKSWSRSIRRTRRDVPFVRAAKSKQWAKALPPESIRSIEAAWGPVMQALGYKLTHNPEELAASSKTWSQWQAQLRALTPIVGNNEFASEHQSSDTSSREGLFKAS